MCMGTYEEAAQITGVALGTVKSRLSRGRAALRDTLRGRNNLRSTFVPLLIAHDAWADAPVGWGVCQAVD